MAQTTFGEFAGSVSEDDSLPLPQLIQKISRMTEEQAALLVRSVGMPVVYDCPIGNSSTGILVQAGATGRGVMVKWDQGFYGTVPFPMRLKVRS